MYQYLTIITFIYLAIIFFISNKLSKKTIVANWGKFWTKRIFLIPIGLVVCALYIAVVSRYVPSDAFMFIAAPVLFYFVGLVAHASFSKVKEYQELAEKHSTYGSMKKKK